MKILKVFLIGIWCLFVISCGADLPHEGPTPPPPSQGLFIEQFNPPSAYKVKDNRLFTVNMQPVLNEMTGIFRMWFEIEYSFNVVGVSNYVYFDETNQGMKTLEWGGGSDFGFGTWNDGYCTIVAYLERYDNFPDPNATHTDQTYKTGSNEIHIYKFLDSDIDSDLYLEFDEQTSQPLYDSNHIENYVKPAYNPILIRFHFQLDQQNLLNDYVVDTPSQIHQYINYNKQYTSWKYACSIKGFKDTNNNILWNLRGKTTLPQNVPPEQLGTLVAVETTLNAEAIPYSNAGPEGFYDKVNYKTLVHELGHQLGLTSDSHTNNHNSMYCVMYQGTYSSAGFPHGRSIYENQHFCINHINEIRSLKGGTW